MLGKTLKMAFLCLGGGVPPPQLSISDELRPYLIRTYVPTFQNRKNRFHTWYHDCKSSKWIVGDIFQDRFWKVTSLKMLKWKVVTKNWLKKMSSTTDLYIYLPRFYPYSLIFSIGMFLLYPRTQRAQARAGYAAERRRRVACPRLRERPENITFHFEKKSLSILEFRVWPTIQNVKLISCNQVWAHRCGYELTCLL